MRWKKLMWDNKTQSFRDGHFTSPISLVIPKESNTSVVPQYILWPYAKREAVQIWNNKTSYCKVVKICNVIYLSTKKIQLSSKQRSQNGGWLATLFTPPPPPPSFPDPPLIESTGALSSSCKPRSSAFKTRSPCAALPYLSIQLSACFSPQACLLASARIVWDPSLIVRTVNGKKGGKTSPVHIGKKYFFKPCKVRKNWS